VGRGVIDTEEVAGEVTRRSTSTRRAIRRRIARWRADNPGRVKEHLRPASAMVRSDSQADSGVRFPVPTPAESSGTAWRGIVVASTGDARGIVQSWCRLSRLGSAEPHRK
jgi:hypothetical protein